MTAARRIHAGGPRRAPGRQGVALAGAIMALVCVSVLVTAAGFASREEQLLGMAVHDSERAFASAERAAWIAFAALVPADSALEVGDRRPVPVSAPQTDAVVANVVRLAPALLLVTGEASVRGRGGALLRRRVGILVRFVRDSTGDGTFEPLPQRAWAELP